MYNVCVLMSSYNGEKYIAEQIESILNQEDVKVHLVIRDDGSTDKTIQIIKSFSGNITLIKGKNIGCEKSFMQLIQLDIETDYYAFSDQDDVWHKSKLKKEIGLIEMYDKPALAACNLLVCNEKLEPIKIMHSGEHIKLIKEKMLSNGIGNMHGCVLLWNRKLHTLLQQYQPCVVMGHDLWVNSVANVVGTVEIESEPYICYRLHGNNVSGYATGIVQRGIKGVRNYLINKHCTMDIYAQELLKGYSDLMDKDSQAYKTIQIVAKYKDSYKSKLKLIHTEIISSCKYPDKLLWYLCVMLGRY